VSSRSFSLLLPGESATETTPLPSSASCFFRCRSRLVCWPKHLSQSGHLNGRCLSWMFLTCLCRLLEMLKDLSQYLHLYGCSPVCVRRCLVRLAERGNTLPQNLQEYRSFILPWTWWWWWWWWWWWGAITASWNGFTPGNALSGGRASRSNPPPGLAPLSPFISEPKKGSPRGGPNGGSGGISLDSGVPAPGGGGAPGNPGNVPAGPRYIVSRNIGCIGRG